MWLWWVFKGAKVVGLASLSSSRPGRVVDDRFGFDVSMLEYNIASSCTSRSKV